MKSILILELVLFSSLAFIFTIAGNTAETRANEAHMMLLFLYRLHIISSLIIHCDIIHCHIVHSKKRCVKYNPVLGKIWMNPAVGLLSRRLG